MDQTFPTAGPPLATPTLDPPLNLPGGAITSTYTVRVGDTLSGIAAATGATVEELQRINGITNPDALKAGQELLVKLPIDERAVRSAG
ncbi:MAG: LysM peptidoglycan-binding domain-containing protein, partial [Chloroflexi bacterium]|nr:LysM peptidoglycan-binding domain-containing protein [Chloroflexota bacterium]